MARIAIVGAGIIGSSWALVFARAGHAVRVFDHTGTARAAIVERVRRAAHAAAAMHPHETPDAIA
ncbi:MAG: 3-hydroxyacyl-CoA dehydrogenase, partial [Alphaproteobacteria bacterium]|nr:3-hydroxyacyl-CoA dehydrogenase [Alphaproteobacteria bacterium]